MLGNRLRETGTKNGVSFVGKKRLDNLVIWTATPRTSDAYSNGNVTGNVSGAVFEHKRPNKRVFTRCERAVLVVFGAKADWTGIEFNPGYPSALASVATE